jgi:hypothetical protein
VFGLGSVVDPIITKKIRQSSMGNLFGLFGVAFGSLPVRKISWKKNA